MRQEEPGIEQVSVKQRAMLHISICYCGHEERLTSNCVHQDGIQSGPLNLVARVSRFGVPNRLLKLVRAGQFMCLKKTLFKNAPFALRKTRSICGCEQTGKHQ